MAKAKHSILSQGIGGVEGAVLDPQRVAEFPSQPGEFVKSSGPTPFIVFYEEHHFTGAIASSFFDLTHLGDWWPEKISSVVIAAGVWELYANPHFEGEPIVLGPGLYDDVKGRINSIRVRR